MSTKIKSKISDAIGGVMIMGNYETSDESTFPAPYDSPRTNSKLSIRKGIDSKVDPKILMLSGCELKSLHFLNKSIEKKTTITSPILLGAMSKDVHYPVDTLKKSLSRLEKKGFISRNSFKCGRGGWTIYEIKKDVMRQLTEDDVGTN